MSRQTANTSIKDNVFTKCYYRGTDFYGLIVDENFIISEFDNQMEAYLLGISPKPLK